MSRPTPRRRAVTAIDVVVALVMLAAPAVVAAGVLYLPGPSGTPATTSSAPAFLALGAIVALGLAVLWVDLRHYRLPTPRDERRPVTRRARLFRAMALIEMLVVVAVALPLALIEGSALSRHHGASASAPSTSAALLLVAGAAVVAVAWAGAAGWIALHPRPSRPRTATPEAL